MNPRLIVCDDRVETYEKSGRWRTLKSNPCIIWRARVYSVPVLFAWNGVTITFMLWWWVSPWLWWTKLATCFHDWFYETGLVSRKEADLIFRALLRYSILQRYSCRDKRTLRGRYDRLMAARLLVKARIMYRAVRAFGEPFYNANL
jgi:hypothetical protein